MHKHLQGQSLSQGPKVFDGHISNNNFLIKKQNVEKSFANELIKLNHEDRERVSFEPVQESKEELYIPQKTKKSSENLDLENCSEEDKKLEKLSEKNDLEILKDNFKQEQELTKIKDSLEQENKVKPSESQIATAVQEHAKVINAAKEGNVAQQEYHGNSNERKKQLANWEDLAPRIIEDPRNKAIRIDIPGLIDIETLIVRLRQHGEISIQAVGDKNTMEKLQAGENILAQKLREKNINLTSLQAIDGNLLGGK